MPFVSRAGLKLDHALREFQCEVTSRTCADFGCNIGGFTDCLLQRGAAKVFSIDTGYGTLAWKLRNDPRVVVMERCNALHVAMPNDATPQAAGVDLVVIDLAWTPQRLAIPAALRWLAHDRTAKSTVSDPGNRDSRIITLVKPHYELSEDEKKSLLVEGRLDHAEAERVLHRILAQMPEWGAQPLAHTLSPITGGKSSKKHGSGNVEFLVLAEPMM